MSYNCSCSISVKSPKESWLFYFKKRLTKVQGWEDECQIRITIFSKIVLCDICYPEPKLKACEKFLCRSQDRFFLNPFSNFGDTRTDERTRVPLYMFSAYTDPVTTNAFSKSNLFRRFF